MMARGVFFVMELGQYLWRICRSSSYEELRILLIMVDSITICCQEQDVDGFQMLLVDDHGCSIACMVIQPGSIIRKHIDAAVAAITGERLVTTAIVVREIGANAIIGAPPAIVKEVSSTVIFHGVLNLGWRIPEGRSLRLARFELRGVLTQEDAP
jgi:hypothetical protein